MEENKNKEESYEDDLQNSGTKLLKFLKQGYVIEKK